MNQSKILTLVTTLGASVIMTACGGGGSSSDEKKGSRGERNRI